MGYQITDAVIAVYLNLNTATITPKRYVSLWSHLLQRERKVSQCGKCGKAVDAGQADALGSEGGQYLGGERGKGGEQGGQ